MSAKICIVIPACNESGNIEPLFNAVQTVFQSIKYEWSLLFVDDGSKDGTLVNIKKLAAAHPQVQYLSLSRNFGHQNALKAGLDFADADAIISMDADLQHPPDLIPALIEQWEAGNDVVYTIRKDHKELPMLKRKTSTIFYNILNNLSDIDLEQGTADFRLMDRKVADTFRNFKESELFIRGLISWMGFKQIGIEYEPGNRLDGQSKYTIKKMVRFALQGITSFSTKPLYIATYLGLFFSMASVFYIPYIIIAELSGSAVSGWASVIATVAFFGGLQLMILGIIGLYLGKLFMQSKQRPHYIIKESQL